jgi:hypothetical protein
MGNPGDRSLRYAAMMVETTTAEAIARRTGAPALAIFPVRNALPPTKASTKAATAPSGGALRRMGPLEDGGDREPGNEKPNPGARRRPAR